MSTAISLLALYRDPLIAANTAHSDWRIADLMTAERPVSLYLVVPPSDISRTRPLVRLILNQIARRLTETLPEGEASGRRLLLMLDEFPALGTATEIRRHRNVSGSRLSSWLPHLTMSEQETHRPLLTPGAEVLQTIPIDQPDLFATMSGRQSLPSRSKRQVIGPGGANGHG